jgi:hypothetical protein
MTLAVFLSLRSWSVEYYGAVLDDARKDSDGVWYCRDLVLHNIHRLPDQDAVTPICENKPQPNPTTGVDLTGQETR